MARNRLPIKPEEAAGNSSGTTRGYRVEARYSYRDAIVINGEIYTQEWREVPVYPVPAGEGITYWPDAVLQHEYLVPYEAAEALRWQFISAARAGKYGAMCLETRIVEYEVKYTFQKSRVAYLDPQDMRGDVPEDMRPPAPEPEASV